MIDLAGINFRALDDEAFDDPFEIGSGAGAIFGATGGVTLEWDQCLSPM